MAFGICSCAVLVASQARTPLPHDTTAFILPLITKQSESAVEDSDCSGHAIASIRFLFVFAKFCVEKHSVRGKVLL
jgi:hypothetical protein